MLRRKRAMRERILRRCRACRGTGAVEKLGRVRMCTKCKGTGMAR